MGKLILLTGGARSGKSSYAEKLAEDIGNKILYIATSISCDKEMEYRIKCHQERRSNTWATIECYKDFDTNLKDKLFDIDAVLLDCITIMVTNIMFSSDIDCENLNQEEAIVLEKMVMDEVDKLLAIISKAEVPFIIVTNEVGMGLVPEYPLSRVFRDIAGRVNQKLGSVSDEVYLCVCGIPNKIK